MVVLLEVVVVVDLGCCFIGWLVLFRGKCGGGCFFVVFEFCVGVCCTSLPAVRSSQQHTAAAQHTATVHVVW